MLPYLNGKGVEECLRRRMLFGLKAVMPIYFGADDSKPSHTWKNVPRHGRKELGIH